MIISPGERDEGRGTRERTGIARDSICEKQREAQPGVKHEIKKRKKTKKPSEQKRREKEHGNRYRGATAPI